LSISRHGSVIDAVKHLHNNLATPYSSRYGSREDIPKYNIPENGIHANAAYQLIHDELDFDGKPNLNLASFVTTYMVSPPLSPCPPRLFWSGADL
jgi:glutamate decarboxylase